MDLVQKSIEIIKKYQSNSGAFPAAPNFSAYNYCWLRDGTFIAYALDLKGERSSSEQFYLWSTRTINKHLSKITHLAEIRKTGGFPAHEQFLHTRYTLEGLEGTEPWGNFQLDGYGTFLWGLSSHYIGVEPPGEVVSVAFSIAKYLEEYWDTPCLDCWEEHGEYVHPSTLAAIYGGLRDIQQVVRTNFEKTLTAIKKLLFERYIFEDHFSKFPQSSEVDANLLWLAVPFGAVDYHEIKFKNTVTLIEKELLTDGLHRYKGDSYYGGGEWLLLTAWLAWYFFIVGDNNKASSLLAWMEEQADSEGNLPEQVPRNMFFPEAYQEWVERWGEIANPLLWSHAMYLIMHDVKQEFKPK